MEHFVFLASLDDFRRKKSDRSSCAFKDVIATFKAFGEAEVDQYQRVFLVKHEVFRLDVAMSHVLLHMHLIERRDDLSGPFVNLLDGGNELVTFHRIKFFLNRFARQELHDQI